MDPIMRYSVHCHAAPYDNRSFVDQDEAFDYAYMLSEDEGYTEVRYGNAILGSYDRNDH